MSSDKKPYSNLLGGYFPYERPLFKTHLTDHETKAKKLSDTDLKTKPLSTFNSELPFQSRFFNENSMEQRKQSVETKSLSDMSMDELSQAKNDAEWAHHNLGGVFNFNGKGLNIRTEPQNIAQSLIGLEIPAIGLATGLVSFIAGERLEEIDQEIQKRMDSQPKNNFATKGSLKKQNLMTIPTSNSSTTQITKPKQKTAIPTWAEPYMRQYGRSNNSHDGNWGRNSGGSRGGWDSGGWSESSKGSKDKGRR